MLESPGSICFGVKKTGMKELVGPQGADGKAGEKGETGEKGEKGADGKPGKDFDPKSDYLAAPVTLPTWMTIAVARSKGDWVEQRIVSAGGGSTVVFGGACFLFPLHLQAAPGNAAQAQS